MRASKREKKGERGEKKESLKEGKSTGVGGLVLIGEACLESSHTFADPSGRPVDL